MTDPGLGTILLVDDDAINRRVMEYVFREANFRVLEAGTGEEALARARSSPDLIVLDVNLPDMSGFDVCRTLKADPATRGISVVHLSAVFVGTEDRTQGLEQGADAYLVKPVEPRELLATVKALLRIRTAEEAARRAANEWRATFDAISDGVCLVDRGGRICRCNRSLCELLGRDFVALFGLPLAEVVRDTFGPTECPPLDWIVSTASRPAHHSEELRLGPRHFRVTSDPLLDDSGHGNGSVVIFRDITQQVGLEEQVRQGQRLEAIGRLAGGVAHEFNNLLTAITGNADFLKQALPETDLRHEMAVTINRAAWRAAELTRQLLGFSRQTLLFPRPIDPAALLDEVLADVQKALPPTVRLEADHRPGLWTVHADPGKLGEAVRQLCRHAVEAMPKGGTLTVAAANVEVSPQEAAAHAGARAGAFVRISVADTGGGLPPERAEHIFDPFFLIGPAANDSLGLPFVHGLVMQHHGWIECRNVPGEGTSFDVYLPRQPDGRQEDGERKKEERAEAPSLTRGRVLVADDNDTLRALAAAYLRQAGYEVLLASDGQEAVEVFARERSRIDLVILDQVMPQLTGSSALQEIRRLEPNVPALIASGAVVPAGLTEAGVQGVVQKPYGERNLLDAVRAALERT